MMPHASLLTHVHPACYSRNSNILVWQEGKRGWGAGGGGAGCVIVHQLFRRCVEIQTSGNVPTTYVTVKAKAFDLVN